MSERNFRLIELPASVEWKLFGFLSAAFTLSVTFPASINSSITILLLVVWILFIPKSFDQLPDVLVMGTLVWIGMLSMFYTTNVEEGWFRLQQKVLLWIVPMIYLTARIDRTRLARQGLLMFVIGITTADIYCLAAAVWHAIQTQDGRLFFSHGLAGSVDVYPYILAVCSLLCQVILLETTSIQMGGLDRRLTGSLRWMLIGFHVMFLFLLSVQQVLFIWVLFVVVVIVHRTKKNLHRILLIGLLTVSTTLAIYWIQPLNQKIKALILNQSTILLDQEGALLKDWNGISLRKAIWTCAWDVITEHPWLGVGTGDGQDALQEAYANRKFYLAALYNRYNAHNQYVQVLICHGIIGVVLWLSSLAWALFHFRQNKLFFIAFGCICLSMMTESMLETNKGNLILAVVTSLFLLCSDRQPQSADRNRINGQSIQS